VLTGRRRVRVWFGDNQICDYIAVTELATRYEQAMRRRFAGLRVTNEPLPDLPDPATLAPLRGPL
jgi:hypothetical protein